MNKIGISNTKRTKKRRKNINDDHIEYDSDETFAFIAGFIEGGAPYGITWGEWRELEKAAELNSAEMKEQASIKDEELPF